MTSNLQDKPHGHDSAGWHFCHSHCPQRCTFKAVIWRQLPYIHLWHYIYDTYSLHTK